MTSPSDPRMLVLHGIRLKGVAEPEGVAETVDVPEVEAKSLLDELVGEGLATYRDGTLSGFTLTREGRAEHSDLLAAELDAAGAREAVRGAYERFLPLNTELLAVCTAWQLRANDGPPTVNDHLDAAYDAAVVDRLTHLHSQAAPVCDGLTAALDRFACYRPRLEAAIDRVRAGDGDWFTKPMLPSYHTVWFELHEDLLSTLGIDRGSEAEVR